MYISITICSLIGSYIPVLWHAGIFSAASIIGGFIGALVGIWVAIKISNFVGN
jgi:hypothetical protein